MISKGFLIAFLTLPRKFTRNLSVVQVVSMATLALGLSINTAFAGDPFRANQPHKIGDRTEAAFRAIFEQGNYGAGEDHLKKAMVEEPGEPLVYALKASLSYVNQDWVALEKYSRKTLETGEKLTATNPLRGNLYTGVGNFLIGATTLTRQGVWKGASQAFLQLKKVYEYLDQAEAIDANDPELSLIRGYMNLMLAVNLPFTSPEQAIEQWQQNAAPRYLVDRGIALAYRDLKQYPEALEYVNRALNSTSDNPEIYYLKAQILHEQAKREQDQNLVQQAIANFDLALAKKSQLPSSLVKQIEYERSQAQARLKSN
ncbi:hypothetical protein CEP10_01955 [Cylindrospermopsis raciborskii S07]|uniref:TPR repeat protein n=3 Tax=Cylindrospermopsis raciborskii TaxID=77022 RepID=A0A853MFY2_9CYAN|nr:Sll0314/Alr1548 family TPR repeat-containing protein [Cylindrospermopsis raciborskii]EFA69609.1 TPR repeat protein [Cylindrospermopsis raciborskii CS-505]MBA4444888.1 hypothetical protein [Cylindrospermopsis raciborskii CS-506_C]MBA4449100.1 hypothetical protein [Cylindrospermopsis raciborskii CS-506_D]MBA4455734.1 hypothetical protein [Cylindrospermopsis raciborskii CS-506_B]MBA4465081.1 hypothetical protein [Cylindrospermopsis raciborskii CS-506_A]